MGDWWAFGEHGYGDRKALVESEEWEGPAYQTCKNVALVCDAFEKSRRRDLVSFSHHSECASLPVAESDTVLDWCEAILSQTGRLPGLGTQTQPTHWILNNQLACSLERDRPAGLNRRKGQEHDWNRPGSGAYRYPTKPDRCNG